MKQLLAQTFNLIRQNRFFAVVSITGTAFTIAFAMVVVMIYDFRTADIIPEGNRDRMIYTDTGYTQRRTNGSNVNSGMGRVAFEALFNDLPGVEEVTWYRGISKAPCSLPASQVTFNYFVRPVAANWFSFFQYDFIAGRPFNREEYDARRGVGVITERMARRLFGTTNAVGKEFLSNFFPVKVVGVVRDVSSIFQMAYADVFLPFSLENEDSYLTWTAGLGGIRLGLLKLLPGTRPADVKVEVQRRQDRLNSTGLEYVFEMNHLYTHAEYTFFRDHSISASLVYGLLVVVLLLVPALSISGLIHAQMQSRLTEIAVRKAYGASNVSVVGRLFSESLLTTVMGGIAGYLLSCLLVWSGRTWLFGTGGVDLSGIALDGNLLLRPALFFAVLGLCLVFNLLSVGLPAWIAVHRSIASTLKGE
jgi:ABC-type antimicrobial peptide transport system, permease component